VAAVSDICGIPVSHNGTGCEIRYTEHVSFVPTTHPCSSHV